MMGEKFTTNWRASRDKAIERLPMIEKSLRPTFSDLIKEGLELEKSLLEIKFLIDGIGGCSADCEKCPFSVHVDDYDPETCLIKPIRRIIRSINNQEVRK